MTDDRSAILARGGRILGLACVAYAKGGRPNSNFWYVLSDETKAAAEQVLAVLNKGVANTALTSAVGACMSKQAATAIPLWVRPLCENQNAIWEIGKTLEISWPPGPKGVLLIDNARTGLAALAIALCRSMDSVRAVAERLDETNGALLVELAALAQCCVEPGEPSEMRARLKRLIREIDNG